jgi:hypothetical protein
VSTWLVSVTARLYSGEHFWGDALQLLTCRVSALQKLNTFPSSLGLSKPCMPGHEFTLTAAGSFLPVVEFSNFYGSSSS